MLVWTEDILFVDLIRDLVSNLFSSLITYTSYKNIIVFRRNNFTKKTEVKWRFSQGRLKIKGKMEMESNFNLTLAAHCTLMHFGHIHPVYYLKWNFGIFLAIINFLKRFKFTKLTWIFKDVHIVVPFAYLLLSYSKFEWAENAAVQACKKKLSGK